MEIVTTLAGVPAHQTQKQKCQNKHSPKIYKLNAAEIIWNFCSLNLPRPLCESNMNKQNVSESILIIDCRDLIWWVRAFELAVKDFSDQHRCRLYMRTHQKHTQAGVRQYIWNITPSNHTK